MEDDRMSRAQILDQIELLELEKQRLTLQVACYQLRTELAQYQDLIDKDVEIASEFLEKQKGEKNDGGNAV